MAKLKREAILEMARAGALEKIRALKAEIRSIESTFGFTEGQTPTELRAPNPLGRPSDKGKMSVEQRKAISVRMRKMWADKGMGKKKQKQKRKPMSPETKARLSQAMKARHASRKRNGEKAAAA